MIKMSKNKKNSKVDLLFIIISALVILGILTFSIINLVNLKDKNKFKSYVSDIYKLIVTERKENNETYKINNMKLVLTDASIVEYKVKYDDDKMTYLCVSNGKYMYEVSSNSGIKKITQTMLENVQESVTSCRKSDGEK